MPTSQRAPLCEGMRALLILKRIEGGWTGTFGCSSTFWVGHGGADAAGQYWLTREAGCGCRKLFELAPFAFVGAVGGLIGAFIHKMNVR